MRGISTRPALPISRECLARWRRRKKSVRRESPGFSSHRTHFELLHDNVVEQRCCLVDDERRRFGCCHAALFDALQALVNDEVEGAEIRMVRHELGELEQLGGT